jgi:phosphoribosylamine--glycine ligase
MMKAMIIGSGGREHAIAEAFARSKKIGKIFVSPGNPGMNKIAEPLLTKDFRELYEVICSRKVDLVFIGPEQPLKDGLSDYLMHKGIKVVGPSREAAQLETSKVFSKNFMRRYRIPTSNYAVFSEYREAASFIMNITEANNSDTGLLESTAAHDNTDKPNRYPLVIKADGLAAGKGVIIAQNKEEALAALNKMMFTKEFGGAGDRVIIEDYLYGSEASVFAFTDGRDFEMTILSRDYKKALDNDNGLNTGGMGAFAPVSMSDEIVSEIKEKVFYPLLNGLLSESIEYKGVIYAGLMLTKQGLHVLEFNCRLGDPETQAVLPLLETDFIDICDAVTDNKIKRLELKWKSLAAVSVVAASQGYPGKYESGKLISIDPTLLEQESLRLYFSNVEENEEKKMVSSGGRVLTLTALAPTIAQARIKAYDHIERIKFSNKFYRTDIALNNY